VGTVRILSLSAGNGRAPSAALIALPLRQLDYLPSDKDTQNCQKRNKTAGAPGSYERYDDEPLE